MQFCPPGEGTVLFPFWESKETVPVMRVGTNSDVFPPLVAVSVGWQGNLGLNTALSVSLYSNALASRALLILERLPFPGLAYKGSLPYANQPIQSRNPTPSSSIKLSHLGSLFSCPNHPRARYLATPDSPSAPEPAEMIH